MTAQDVFDQVGLAQLELKAQNDFGLQSYGPLDQKIPMDLIMGKTSFMVAIVEWADSFEISKSFKSPSLGGVWFSKLQL